MAENGAPPLTLADALADACNAVLGVEKRGRNITQNYDYQKAEDIFAAFRNELFSRRILLLEDEVDLVSGQVSVTNLRGETRQFNRAVLKVEYEIKGHGESIVKRAWGEGWDMGDKAIYKAKTGADKYFLKRLGLIPDQKLDPEADESLDKQLAGRERPRPPQARPTPGNEVIPILQPPNASEVGFTEEPVKRPRGRPKGSGAALAWPAAFYAVAETHGHNEAEAKEFLKNLGNWASAKDVPKDRVGECMKWAATP